MVALPAPQAAGAIRAIPRDIHLEARLVEAVVAVVGFLGGGRFRLPVNTFRLCQHVMF